MQLTHRGLIFSKEHALTLSSNADCDKTQKNWHNIMSTKKNLLFIAL
jgi:hypothetical protein